MIIIGTGLLFTMFIITLCFYGLIFGGILFLAMIITPTCFILGSIVSFISDSKKAKKGEIPPLKDVDYVCFGFWFVMGILFLIKITIPFFQA